jgi:DinB superfamily
VGLVARDVGEAMSKLDGTLASVLVDRYAANAARVRELAAPLTEKQFWQKPFAYGNSFGHLVLHLTGNLNYYIGAQIAKNGYVRDRPREFAEANPPAKEEALKRFDDAVAMVQQTIRAQAPEDWSAEYSGTGTNAKIRLDMIMQCAAHMQHHIGQMIYLNHEWARQR